MCANACVVMQIAHPSFLRWTVPAIEGPQVRLAHTRPAYENVSLHGDVFSQVCPQQCLAHLLPTCFIPEAKCNIMSQSWLLERDIALCC